MGVYQNGTAVLVEEVFYVETVPSDFTTAVPTDPTTVTFYVRAPDNDLLAFVFGVDAEITNPSVGKYILELASSVLTPAGFWKYRVTGTGDVDASAEGDFEILPSSVLEPVVAEPGFAPCQSWCDEQDIADLCGADVGSDISVFTDAAAEASFALYRLSGEQFTGICRQTVRPFSDSCGCWPWIVAPASPGVPQTPAGWGQWGGAGWGWGWEGCGGAFGCGPVSRVLLPGYPVTSIVEVEIDGVVLADTEYRLDGWRHLTRMANTDGNPQFWPGCQNISRPLGEVGTWGVSCTTGQAPPSLGQKAAAQLGCEVFRATSGEECKLPAGAVSVNRQGITVQLAPFRAWGQIDGQWATGMNLVDLFLASTNPVGLRRRSAIWSPDIEPYAQRLGNGTGS